MSNITDKLEIKLITWNRDVNLNYTLQQILAENSPIKDFDITVLDNCATDSTPDVVKYYMQSHPNLKYEKNIRNIGGNGNISKAYYSAKKEYIWVICDDDYFCWDSWDEVEQAIEQKKDAIVVSNFDNPNKNVARWFLQATFVPAMIYKTEILDDYYLMFNMLNNIPNWFPHLAIASKILNEKKDYVVVKEGIVISGNVYKHVDLPDLKTIGIEKVNSNENNKNEKLTYVPKYIREMSWVVGFANSLNLIEDKNIRRFIANNNKFFSNFTSAKFFFVNRRESKNNLYNLVCVFSVLCFADKIKFLINAFLAHTLYALIYFDVQESLNKETNEIKRKYILQLFTFIKISVFKKYLPKEKIL